MINFMVIDFGLLFEDELDGIFEFVFLCYFEDLGLFGLMDDVIVWVEYFKMIGVGEIVCLIDYGIVLE